MITTELFKCFEMISTKGTFLLTQGAVLWFFKTDGINEFEEEHERYDEYNKVLDDVEGILKHVT